MISELVTARHLSRKAVVYIRQSHPQQRLNNQESLRLQYALCRRACDLGLEEADVEVIDTDLGLSGAAVDHRRGFKDLIARVTLGEIGIILSYDVTRLARNCSDWYPLLDLCGYRQCLIADRDGVYDPGSANGRLLLGRSHSIRIRHDVLNIFHEVTKITAYKQNTVLLNAMMWWMEDNHHQSP